jgi:hypothetical protein
LLDRRYTHKLHAPRDLILQDGKGALHAFLSRSGESIEIEPPA